MTAKKGNEMRKRTNRTEVVSVRLSPENLRAAKLVARLTCRSVSELMEYTLQQFIVTNHPEAFNPNVSVELKLGE